jgi:hypothetical protein
MAISTASRRAETLVASQALANLKPEQAASPAHADLLSA